MVVEEDHNNLRVAFVCMYVYNYIDLETFENCSGDYRNFPIDMTHNRLLNGFKWQFP